MGMTQENYDAIKTNGDYFESQLNGQPGFLITYEVITEESAENGEVDEHGYEGSHSCQPDVYDIEDGKDAVDLAIEYLRDKCIEASSSHFHPGVWYSDADPDADYRTGDESRNSYHPYNWTPEQEEKIFKAVTAR